MFNLLWRSIVILLLDFPLALLLTRGVVVVIAFTAHELAHALVATLLGDPTPRERGRLTLNPAPHLESIGVITGVLIGLGWSKPTPYRPHKTLLPAWLSGTLIALAGPLASLGLAYLSAIPFRMGWLTPDWPWGGWPTLAHFVTVMMSFNALLAFLNLLPLFPLDGFRLVLYWLPLRPAAVWQRASGWTTVMLGVPLFLLLMLPPRLFEGLLGPLARGLFRLMLGT